VKQKLKIRSTRTKGCILEVLILKKMHCSNLLKENALEYVESKKVLSPMRKSTQI
jgi:hypothetical protein